MLEPAQILGFTVAVLVLVLVPGPNTMLILAHSLAGGRRAGLATVLGVEVGTLLHTLSAALGLSALLATSSTAYTAVKAVGVAYLLALAVSELRAREETGAGTGAAVALGAAFWRAVLNNVTNPKVAVFFLAFLPQFVRAENGHVALQLVSLGLIVSAVGLVFGSLLAITAARARRWLRQPTVIRWQRRLTGALFLGLGVHLALEGD